MFLAGGTRGNAKRHRGKQGAQAAWHVQQILFGTLFGTARPDPQPGQTIGRMTAKNMSAGAVSRRRQGKMLAEIHRHHGIQQALALQQIKGL